MLLLVLAHQGSPRQNPERCKMVVVVVIIIFRLPQPLDGCWCLLCQGSGYFSQPKSFNILPDVTLVRIQYPSQYS